MSTGTRSGGICPLMPGTGRPSCDQQASCALRRILSACDVLWWHGKKEWMTLHTGTGELLQIPGVLVHVVQRCC